MDTLQLLTNATQFECAGYVSARLYKTFKGKQWQRCTAVTVGALSFPSPVPPSAPFSSTHQLRVHACSPLWFPTFLSTRFVRGRRRILLFPHSAHLNEKQALWYPGICFAVFLCLDLIDVSYGSSGAYSQKKRRPHGCTHPPHPTPHPTYLPTYLPTHLLLSHTHPYPPPGAVPFLEMLKLLTLWFGISVPLVFMGAYAGYRQEPLAFPVVTSNIPKQVRSGRKEARKK